MTRGLLLFALTLTACGDAEPAVLEGDVVARVGDAVLTESDLEDAIGSAPSGLDSLTARSHVVEQWVQRELLVQEARAQGLDQDPGVQRLLDESERATLEAAALDAYFAQSPAEPTEADLEDYYAVNGDALALREPYVRLRHLRITNGRATEARDALARALTSEYPDSLFVLIAREFTDDPDGAVALASEYVPEGRIRALDEALGLRVASLPAGAQVVAVPVGASVHVVQVVDRVPAGTVPPLSMVRDELSERIAIRNRREAEARLLQQLRSEAQARGQLELTAKPMPGARSDS
ncbi:peptidyl-prolyl cis-trans isomerase [Rubrivirga sp.]|uniref:peptidyl-prolyl cis-trans isomerase n=1 Tax=Rubrivirga sp. TaxID=1885344 RepID=UPI003C73251E